MRRRQGLAREGAPVRVRVAVCAAGHAHQVLLAVVADLLAPGEGADLRLVHSCPECGSSAHGRPVVVGAPTVDVSLARERDGALAVVAASRDARIGIDVERAGSAAFAGFAGVALHPRELARPSSEHTRLWVGKEAVLKCRGTGLAVDPRSVLLDEVDEQLVDVDLGEAWCCRLAVGSRQPVQVR